MLLWGPPGTGKTSLARLLADEIGAHFTSLSAVMSGVADVRGDHRRGAGAARPSTARGRVLFLDEIHRFNKAQQDALLPHVEDGTVTLIGATTENPYFEVNSALLSRMRVWRLEALTDEDVGTVVRRALDDAERGLAGALGPTAASRSADDAFDHCRRSPAATPAPRSTCSRARTALAEAEDIRDTDGRVSPRLEDVEGPPSSASSPTTARATATTTRCRAFIKSLRGNDPDAALYWLARMVAAGEDPRFIARRLIISASEDVGNADPRALQVAVAAAQALDWSGCRRRNTRSRRRRYIARRRVIRSGRHIGRRWASDGAVAAGPLPPAHRRRSTDEAAWHRRRLPVPARVRGHDVAQQYLPDKLHEAGRRYYYPTEQGVERQIGERMEGREAARTAGPPKPRKPDRTVGSRARASRARHAHPRRSAQDAGRDPEEGRG